MKRYRFDVLCFVGTTAAVVPAYGDVPDHNLFIVFEIAVFLGVTSALICALAANAGEWLGIWLADLCGPPQCLRDLADDEDAEIVAIVEHARRKRREGR